MPTKRKAKLWGKIAEILACKTTKFGAKKISKIWSGWQQDIFRKVLLRVTTKEAIFQRMRKLKWIWLREHPEEKCCAGTTWLSVVFAVLFIYSYGLMQHFEGKELQSPTARKDAVKASLRCAKWAARAENLVNSINKVLRKPVSERKAALKEIPQSVKEQLQMSRFLTGGYFWFLCMVLLYYPIYVYNVC